MPERSPSILPACSRTTRSSSSRPPIASNRSFRSTSSRPGATVPRGSRCSRSADSHLPGLVRPRHERARRRHRTRGGHLRPHRRRCRPRSGPQADALHGRGARRLPRGRARRLRQRHRRRVLRARRRLRPQARREDDGEGAARHRGLRVGVPDEPPEPAARARRSRRSTSCRARSSASSRRAA